MQQGRLWTQILASQWSEMDLSDPKDCLDQGNTFAQTASFLCRDEDEVRQKARMLGLIEHGTLHPPSPLASQAQVLRRSQPMMRIALALARRSRLDPSKKQIDFPRPEHRFTRASASGCA
jgi:hypothetical protein